MLYLILAVLLLIISLICIILVIRYCYLILKHEVFAENIEIHKERIKCILPSIIFYWISIICGSVLVEIELNVFDIILPIILVIFEIIVLECKKRELF